MTGCRSNLLSYILLVLLTAQTATCSCQPKLQTCDILEYAATPRTILKDETAAWEEVLLFTCFNVQPNTLITVYEAKSSEDRNKIQCGDRWAFRYENGLHVNISLKSNPIEKECNDSFCVVVSRKGTKMYFTGPLQISFNQSNPDQVIGLETELPTDSVLPLSDYAKALLKLYVSGILDELAIRRILLLKLTQKPCKIEDKVNVRIAPLGSCATLNIVVSSSNVH